MKLTLAIAVLDVLLLATVGATAAVAQQSSTLPLNPSFKQNLCHDGKQALSAFGLTFDARAA